MTTPHKHDKKGIACNHVVRRKRPVMIVSYDEDGLWQFMCGKVDHTKAKPAKKVCAACTFEAHAPGIATEDIPPGHIAERQTKTTWTVRALTQAEKDEIEG